MELFQEEREMELEERQRVEKERAMQVPGLIKPSQRDDDEEL